VLILALNWLTWVIFSSVLQIMTWETWPQDHLHHHCPIISTKEKKICWKIFDPGIKSWFSNIQCSLGLSPPRFIAKILVCPDFPHYTAKLSYRHPPQVFRYKSRKTNLNSPISTTHNYLLTAVYWSVMIECQNWSSDTVIDLIVEGRNRSSVVLIRIITCIYFSSDYICTFNPE
jgi:hypothetical protein